MQSAGGTVRVNRLSRFVKYCVHAYTFLCHVPRPPYNSLNCYLVCALWPLIPEDCILLRHHSRTEFAGHSSAPGINHSP